MSSGQRKRPGGAADSGPARKRSRLQPSSTGGTSQAEPIELVESGTAALEPAAGQFIDLSSQSSVPEVIVILSDDESPLDREQSQEQPHVSRVSDNSVEQQAKEDEEEPREDHGAWPAVPASPSVREDETSEVQDREQSQLYPLGSRDTEDSAELWASDDEEEAIENDSAWTENVSVSPNWKDDYPEDGEESQPCPFGSRAAENADEVPANENEEEPQDIELRPSGSLLCVICRSCYSQLHEVYEQRSRNSIRNSCQQMDGSGHGTGADDAPVAESGPAEQGAAEEGTARSDAQQGVVIRCPICMDFYSEMLQSGRQLVATMCGHLFCSECLPVALETVGTCPTCRMELTPDLYFPIYI